MNIDLKSEFDPAADALFRAARENKPGQCAEYFGKAARGAIFVNSQALRIAAENKNYDAFDAMMALSAEDVAGSNEIGDGPDWNRVQEIAKTDRHIAESIRQFDARQDAIFDEIGRLRVERSGPAVRL